jgi:hypothetical protein
MIKPSAILDNWTTSILWMGSDIMVFWTLGQQPQNKISKIPQCNTKLYSNKNMFSIYRHKQLTDSPIFSPLSEATLSETVMADIRLG